MCFIANFCSKKITPNVLAHIADEYFFLSGLQTCAQALDQCNEKHTNERALLVSSAFANWTPPSTAQNRQRELEIKTTQQNSMIRLPY